METKTFYVAVAFDTIFNPTVVEKFDNLTDAETYAAQFMLGEKLRWCKENDITVIKGNIGDTSLVDATITSNGIDSIVNFAAESHVDNSIKRPNVFFETNVLGTVSLLNVAKKHNLRFH